MVGPASDAVDEQVVSRARGAVRTAGRKSKSRRDLSLWLPKGVGTFGRQQPVPITAKDPFRLLAQPASPLPGGTDKPLLSRRRLPSWYGANNGEGSFGTFGTVPITAKDPDRILTRVRRRVALWLPKGVGTFGRLKTGAPGRLCRMPPHDVRLWTQPRSNGGRDACP